MNTTVPQQTLLDRCIQEIRVKARLLSEASASSLATFQNGGKAEGRPPRFAGTSVLENFEKRLAQCVTDGERSQLVVGMVRELNQHRLGRPVAGMSPETWRTLEAEKREQEGGKRPRHSDRRRALIEARLAAGRTYAEIAAELRTTPASIRMEAKRIRDRRAAENPSDGGHGA